MKIYFAESRGKNELEIPYEELSQKLEDERLYDIIYPSFSFMIKGERARDIIKNTFEDSDKVLIVAGPKHNSIKGWED